MKRIGCLTLIRPAKHSPNRIRTERDTFQPPHAANRHDGGCRGVVCGHLGGALMAAMQVTSSKILGLVIALIAGKSRLVDRN
jgi:hypothetical protein